MSMFEQLGNWLLSSEGLTPHGFCLQWEPGLIWTYAISDSGIALAYLSIPLSLAVFARRRCDLVFRPIFRLFAAFILLCGATHLLDVVTLWLPAYGLEGVVKAATAIVSIMTSISLWRLLPAALALPSPAQLEAANTALGESEGRYRAIFEYSPIPKHTLDANGIIQDVSQSWLALLGYSKQEVLGRHITSFQPVGPGSWIEDDSIKLMANGAIQDLERRYRRRDGTVVDTLLSARLEKRDEGAWIVCVLIDVTERRRTEQALRATEERLHQAQKMEAVGQLTGGIAHDFNNMLQGVLGALEMIERRITQGRVAETARYIDSARKSADSAAALTHRMLAFARRQALQPTVIDPGVLLQGMTPLLQSGIGPTVRLELAFDEPAWYLACDASQLESVLLNLAINARDAMPEGGTLTISTAGRILTTTDVADQHGTQPGDYVEIAVADTGTGMSPDVMLRAFEPFFTTKLFGRGTGLGLSQVYGFVHQSGGFVRLQSQLGHGTTVRLFLPRADRSASSGDWTSATSSASGATAQTASSTTVLVVEDEERVREMIVTILAEQGYSVMEAEDGSAGLRILRSPVQIDLLVTDVGIPGLNGSQLAGAARANRPKLPVLFITGYAGTALDDTGLIEGTQILRKPFAFDALSARVRDMVDSVAS